MSVFLHALIAHVFETDSCGQIGQALRLALGQGMHTDMPPHVLDEAALERSRRVWWTVYVLEREMTSLTGLPQSIHDEDVTTPLPAFSGSAQQIAAHAMRIRLLRVMTRINRSINSAVLIPGV